VSPTTNDRDTVSGSSGLGDQGDQPMEDILADSEDSEDGLDDGIDCDDGSDQRDTDCEMRSVEEERSPNETQNNPMSEDSTGSEFHSDAGLESELDSTSGMLMLTCSSKSRTHGIA
jgi:hypothetical protein